RSGVAIDAAVLATAVGIDRLLEADVGAVVGRDDALGRLPVHIRLERLKLAQALPAVVKRLALFALETADPVRTGTPPAPPPSVYEIARVRLGPGPRLWPPILGHHFGPPPCASLAHLGLRP